MNSMYDKRKNIFRQDDEGNYVYFVWDNFGKGYIVNNSEKREKLSSLEEYRYLVLSYKPPIIIPIIIFSMIVSIGLIFIGKVDIDIKSLVVQITFFSYIVSALFYIHKIYKILKGCKKSDLKRS